MSDAGPWLAIAGLGLFHGLNPAMGWLFAVALGLHRHSQRVVLISLLPIALGHAAAVAAVLAVALMLGLVLDATTLLRLAAIILIGWALWHFTRGHRQRVRVGMQAGLLGLALWSFLMASAHGAGLMLIPVVMPLCLANSPAAELAATGSLPIAAAALALHTAVDAGDDRGDIVRGLSMDRRGLPATRMDQSRHSLDRSVAGVRCRAAG